MQVHDEIVFLVRETHLPAAAKLVRDTMQGAAEVPGMWSLPVTLPVKLQVGPSWGELTEYTLA